MEEVQTMMWAQVRRICDSNFWFWLAMAVILMTSKHMPDLGDTIALSLLMVVMVFLLLLAFWDRMSRKRRLWACSMPLLFGIAIYTLPRLLSDPVPHFFGYVPWMLLGIVALQLGISTIRIVIHKRKGARP